VASLSATLASLRSASTVVYCVRCVYCYTFVYCYAVYYRAVSVCIVRPCGGSGGPITARMSSAITRGGRISVGRTGSRALAAGGVVLYRVVEENGPGPRQGTRYSVATRRGFAPLITPPRTRSCGITVPPISMCIMRIPPPWIRNLRWYSLMATTFALAWAGAWGIDVILSALTVAVALQFLAIVLD